MLVVILLPAWPSLFYIYWRSSWNSHFNSVISIVLFAHCLFKGGGPLSYDALAKTLILFLAIPTYGLRKSTYKIHTQKLMSLADKLHKQENITDIPQHNWIHITIDI